MVIAKTPNKNRKSVGNADGVPKTPQSPKAGKLNTSVKTPGFNKGNATPGKNKTPKPTPQQNKPQTPKGGPNNPQTPKAGQKPQTPKGGPNAPKQTPFKNQQASAKKQNKNKRASDSGVESSPPKKMKKFGGTAGLEESPEKKQPQKQGKKKGEGSEKKRKGQFFHLKEKLEAGNQAALVEVDEKIKAIESRTELTKTAKRKIRILQKLRCIITGEKREVKPPTASKKRRERKKDAKAKHQTAEGETSKAPQKKTEVDEDSSESEEETDIGLDKILKTETVEEEESDDGEEEESGEEEDESEDDDEEDEEDESDEEEEVAPAPKGKQSKAKDETSESPDSDSKKKRFVVFVGNLPFDATKQEISEHFVKAGTVRHVRIPTEKGSTRTRGFAYVEFDEEVSYQKALSMHHTFIKGRRINCLYTQGGKKKGQERKNEVKAKNLKLHAMRKQGQLAGSVKQNQKRSARRAKNAKPVNGSH